MRILKLSLILAVLFSCAFHGKAQLPDFEWAKMNTGTGSSVNYLMTIDPFGDVISFGNYADSTDFDPGPNEFYYVDSLNSCYYLHKLDTAGNFKWVKRISGELYFAMHNRHALKTDSEGNIYFTAGFKGTIDLDPGPNASLHTALGEDGIAYFIAKYSPNGDLMYAYSFGGQENRSMAFGLEIDKKDNIYLIGLFRDEIDFDPGPGTQIITPYRGSDSFLQKFDKNGDFKWVKWFRNDWTLGISNIQITFDETLVLSGNFRDSVDLDPGPNVVSVVNDKKLVGYMMFLDTNGNYLKSSYIKGYYQGSYVSYSYVSSDPSGGVTSVGFFQGTVDLDPSAGIYNVSVPTNKMGIFIQKLDKDLNFVWGYRIVVNETNSWQNTDLNTDINGNIYYVSYFNDSLNLEIGLDTLKFYGNGETNSYILKLDSNGKLNSFLGLKGGYQSTFNAIDFDSKYNLFVAGGMTGDCTLYPDTSAFHHNTPFLKYNAFVMKFRQCMVTRYTDTIVACDNYTWIDGNTYGQSTNSRTYTLTNVRGCDSIVSLDLTIIPIQNSDSVHACDEFLWANGTLFKNDTTATFKYKNRLGCDSVVTLNLQINHSTAFTDVITACNKLKWIDDITYTSNNTTAKFITQNNQGCDSIISLDLEVKKQNTMLDFDAITLRSLQDSVSYQWLNCGQSFYPILNETEQGFVPNSTGFYAVELSSEYCVDTSACLPILNLNSSVVKGYRIYPNPSLDEVSIEFYRENNKIDITIYSALGQLVYTQTFLTTNRVELPLYGAAGVYLVLIQGDNGEIFKERILKQ